MKLLYTLESVDTLEELLLGQWVLNVVNLPEIGS